MAEFPKSHDELIAAGYKLSGEAECRACCAAIVWYKTPKGKSIPLDRTTFEPHWASCPNAADFRKGGGR